jgi:hypothetical protein
MMPRVSVYWLSLHRRIQLKRAVESFLARTCYPELELIVVDCSPEDAPVREWIASCGYFDQMILRERQYCIWNNANSAFEASSGEYILHLENDVEIVPNSSSWLNYAVEELDRDPQLALSLAIDASETEPHSLGFVTSRNVRRQWHPWKCYPADYSTISESIDRGDRERKARFREMGFHARGILALRHDISAPSMNLTKLHRLHKIPYETLDDAMSRGLRVMRRRDSGYVDLPSYLAAGSWQACEWILASEDGGDPPDGTTMSDLMAMGTRNQRG